MKAKASIRKTISNTYLVAPVIIEIETSKPLTRHRHHSKEITKLNQNLRFRNVTAVAGKTVRNPEQFRENNVWSWAELKNWYEDQGKLIQPLNFPAFQRRNRPFCHYVWPTNYRRINDVYSIGNLLLGSKVILMTNPSGYSISQEICTRFLLCCALLWLYIDWFYHIYQAYFIGTVAI